MDAAWVNLALAYRGERSYNLAIAAYDALLKLRPKDADALVSRANIRLALGDHAGAMADYDAALAIDPSDLMALFDRALEHRKAGRLEAALADYEALLRSKPDDDEARRARDAVKARMAGQPTVEPSATSRREWTIASMTDALVLDPRAVWALVRRAKEQLASNRPALALADFDAALAIEPGNIAAQDGRARAAAATSTASAQ